VIELQTLRRAAWLVGPVFNHLIKTCILFLEIKRPVVCCDNMKSDSVSRLGTIAPAFHPNLATSTHHF
jgi:hypothetical protein